MKKYEINFHFEPNRYPSSFQSPATPVMEGIIDLHNYVFFYVVLIFVFVISMLCFIFYQFFFVPNSYIFINKKEQSKFFSKQNDDDAFEPFFGESPFVNHVIELDSALAMRHMIFQSRRVAHGTMLEIIWTIIPSLILVAIAIPSFALLYAMDEVINPEVTLKIVGRQWYWVYEHSYINSNDEIVDFAVQSHMLGFNEMPYGGLRLLEVTAPMIVPVDTHIRLIITASDVLHSWAVPSLGIKVDAVPGRLNQVSLFLKREGVFYGQCSELCGVNHGFMPIVVLGTDPNCFHELCDGIIDGPCCNSPVVIDESSSKKTNDYWHEPYPGFLYLD
jgi:cytochrome c oxidase subunit 2